MSFWIKVVFPQIINKDIDCGNHCNRRHKDTSSATESLTESAFWVRPQSMEAKVSQLSRRKNLVAAMCPY